MIGSSLIQSKILQDNILSQLQMIEIYSGMVLSIIKQIEFNMYRFYRINKNISANGAI